MIVIKPLIKKKKKGRRIHACITVMSNVIGYTIM